ncbi:MAG: hypothetical protein WKF70_12410 [Chitinophagaceae bacterium]
MLENISNLVKEEAGDAIINNPAVPNQHNEAVIEETSNSIIGSLKNLLASGGAGKLLAMFGNNGSDVNTNTVTQNASGNVSKSLVDKFGLNQAAATGIAGSVVPTVLKKMINRTNDPGDSSFNVQDIFNQLSGGQTSKFNLSSLVAKAKSSLDFDKDGDTDLQDLKSLFTSSNTNTTGGTTGGSPLDSIKGM